MTRYPHPDHFPYRSWSYSQGLMLMGFVHLYEKTGEGRYRDYVLKYADFHVSPEGKIYRFTGSSMDDMMAGAVIVWAYRETGEERYRLACEEILSKFDDFPRTSKGGFWHSRHAVSEMWVDGVFMGGMFLTHYGSLIGKSEACFSEVVKQLNVIHECCHKKGGLLYHAWSECLKTPWANRITGCSTDVWSEGLGWYALILAETVRLMPDAMPKKQQVIHRLTELLDTLSAMQCAMDGLFYQVVDKGNDPQNWTDTSGSAMFLYAFAQAVRMGIGDCETYKQVVQRCWQGVQERCVCNEKGLIDVLGACDGLCVQNNYDAYITYPRVANAKEAVGAVLWAAALLEPSFQSSPNDSLVTLYKC